MTTRLWHIAAWPLVVKVPVLVAGLMVTVAVATSQVVLWRFAQDQKSNLELLTGAYLDGLSAAVLPALVRRDARGVFDALDRAFDAGLPILRPGVVPIMTVRCTCSGSAAEFLLQVASGECRQTGDFAPTTSTVHTSLAWATLHQAPRSAVIHYE